MNIDFLRTAVDYARQNAGALNMTTDVSTELSLQKELKLRLGEYRMLISRGEAEGDLASLAVAASTEGSQRPTDPRYIQETFINRAGITFAQYEKLNFFPLWPAPFAEQYRAAIKAGDYDWQVAVFANRLEFFVKTRGNDLYENQKTKTRTPAHY